MNVLLLGHSGFIGRHLAAALASAGHTCVPWCGGNGGRPDMAKLCRPEDWLPWVQHADVVINAVGVLRDTRAKPLWSLHAHAPQALFEACAMVGGRRVIQISALGTASGQTDYARSKRVADEHLLHLTAAGQVSGVVLRPSIVVGEGGASTRLFGALARLPWLVLPKPVADGMAQPLLVQDLVTGCMKLLDAQRQIRGVVNVVGPEALSIEALIAAWRSALGLAPAVVWRVPDGISRASAHLGDLVPVTPWGSATLEMLAQPNVAPVGLWAAVLGHEPRSVRQGPMQEGGEPCVTSATI